jgi:hypothetical protein
MLRYILCASLVLAGCSSTKQSGITKPIHVTCEGRSFDHAKNVCFSNAIEFAVGAVVVSDMEVRNSRLAKDEILKHSSGYVDDFNITNRVDQPNRVMLSMDVTVKQSKIAERIIGAQKPTGEVNGQRLGAQYSTFMQNKDTGDKLLSTILKDFPRYSFVVEKGEVLYQVDINRNPVIVVPFTIKWNYKYLQSLNEALSITSDAKSLNIIQEKVSISAKDPKAWLLGRTDDYYFNDASRARMIKSTFVQPVYVVATFKDNSGRVLLAGCDDGRFFNGPHITDPFRINGNETVDEEMVVTIRVNKHKVQYISEVELSLSTRPCTFIE